MQKLTLFLFQAYDPKREAHTRGSWFAASEEKARYWLEQQGLVEIRLRASMLSQSTVRVDPTALALFFRQLSVLVQSGTSLPFALRLVSYTEDQHLAGVCLTLESQVAAGNYLSTAMSLFPMVFDRVNLGLVRAGEESGRLGPTLLDIADAEERRASLRGRVIAALTYPLVLAGFTLLVTGVFVFYVLPLDNELFGSMGIELPFVNRLLLSMVDLVSSPWLPLVLLSFGGLAWAILRRVETRRELVRWAFRTAAQLPALDRLLQKARAVRLLQILSLVLTSGGTVETAMKLMHSAYSEEAEQRQAIEELRQEVMNGIDFGVALDRSALFPDIVGALLRVGYETAKLEQMSRRAVDMCEEDVRIGLDTLASLIEPVLLAFAGLVAAFVVITAAMPMLKLIQTL